LRNQAEAISRISQAVNHLALSSQLSFHILCAKFGTLQTSLEEQASILNNISNQFSLVHQATCFHSYVTQTFYDKGIACFYHHCRHNYSIPNAPDKPIPTNVQNAVPGCQQPEPQDQKGKTKTFAAIAAVT
jgi:hypothetical protein